MTKEWIFLIVTFLDVDGQPLYFDGWSPKMQPSMEVCEIRKEFIENYLQQDYVVPDGVDKIVVTCE